MSGSIHGRHFSHRVDVVDPSSSSSANSPRVETRRARRGGSRRARRSVPVRRRRTNHLGRCGRADAVRKLVDVHDVADDARHVVGSARGERERNKGVRAVAWILDLEQRLVHRVAAHHARQAVGTQHPAVASLGLAHGDVDGDVGVDVAEHAQDEVALGVVLRVRDARAGRCRRGAEQTCGRWTPDRAIRRATGSARESPMCAIMRVEPERSIAVTVVPSPLSSGSLRARPTIRPWASEIALFSSSSASSGPSASPSSAASRPTAMDDAMSPPAAPPMPSATSNKWGPA